MVDVSTDAVIRCPVQVVARFAMDPDNAPLWYVNIAAVEWQTPKPLRVGSRLRFVAHFLRRRLAYTYEVLELVPDRRLRMHTAEGPFPMETTYDFESISETECHMQLRNRGEPSGFAAVLSPFVAIAMRRANRKDLDKLRRLLEPAA